MNNYWWKIIGSMLIIGLLASCGTASAPQPAVEEAQPATEATEPAEAAEPAERDRN